MQRARRFSAAGDGLILAALLAIVAVAYCTANALWTAADWNLPTAYLDPYKSDVIHALAMMKVTAEGEFVPLAWKGSSHLGAPAGANWNDWPMIEELLVVAFGLLARFAGLFAGLNLAMLLGNLLAAAVFYGVARASACSRTWAFTAALAFGLAPFIFAQSPYHITCAWVWHVPLFMLVWRWVSTDPGIEPWTPRFWQAVAIGFGTGLLSPYFTNILCQFTLLGAGIRYWRNRSRPQLLAALAVIAAAAAAFALMNVDSWTYRLAHGANTGALVREYKWLEIYGLKLVDLVIPPVTHRCEPFAGFATMHRFGDPARNLPPATPLQDEGSYLGIVGLVALAWLAATAVRDVLGGREKQVPGEAWQVLWIFLVFTNGGLNAIAGAMGVTMFRSGCRYSLVILAIVLLWAARRLSAWQATAPPASDGPSDRPLLGGDGRWLAAAAVVCIVILWDQVPRPPSAEERNTIARQVTADREFAERMEAALPPGGMVFQLPVMDFPEAPGAIPPYDHFRPYLYTKHVRYSFGSMKGREREKWQQAVQNKFIEGATVNQQAQRIVFDSANARAAVDELRRLGFSAIYVNRNAFPDRGRGIEDVLLELGYEKPPIRNATGELACIVLDGPAPSGRGPGAGSGKD